MPNAPSPRETQDVSPPNGHAPERTSGEGEGVDRRIDKKLWTPKRVALLAGALLFVAVVGYGLWTTTGGQRLHVERERLTVATVERGPFQDFISVTGTVQPRQTVYLDAVVGGRVEEIFVREGAMLEGGDPILRLSNNDLQLQLINAEMQRIEQLNRLQNTRMAMEQNRLDLQQQLTEMDYQTRRLTREHDRLARLHEKDLVADDEYEAVRDELDYWQRRRELTLQSYRQDSLRQARQVDQLEDAAGRMDASYEVIEDVLDNLTLRAPVSGQLTALDAELGELRSSGFRFGQIDVLDDFKVRAAIDEYYIARVRRGQTGSGETGGRDYDLRVTRVYPEVRDGRFEVDLAFGGTAPPGIRRGQTLRFRLTLGDPTEAVLLPRGGFYQSTGGNWAFVLGPDDEEATRRPIRLGRQNPQYFEVLGGLQPGDRVVTNSYDTYGDAERLVLD